MNTALYQLYFEDNQLATLDVSKNTALSYFACTSNKLTSLDVSKNIVLTIFDCSSNLITTLDVSKNTALTDLSCSSNQLTTLDVSKNTGLFTLDCSSNQLTTLDVSHNTDLIKLDCSSNQLTSLNIKNGANTIFADVDFQNNPNLSCIQVDDKAYSDANWSASKDATASYANVCTALGSESMVFATMSIYPNPAKGELHIDNVTLEKASVYDALGKLVQSASFDNVSDKNTLNLSGLVKGNYYVFIEGAGVFTAKQIVIE